MSVWATLKETARSAVKENWDRTGPAAEHFTLDPQDGA